MITMTTSNSSKVKPLGARENLYRILDENIGR